MAANRFRRYSVLLLGAATAATALLTAACSGSATVAANGSTTTMHWSAVQDAPTTSTASNAGTAAGSGSGGGPRSTSANPTVVATKLQFPNTSNTVFIGAYDSSTQMITFHVVKWVPGGLDDGHFDIDPSKPGDHRLPLAATMDIKAVSTLCAGMTEPNLSGVPCTKDNFIKALEGGSTGYADIHVDASDHVDALDERFVS